MPTLGVVDVEASMVESPSARPPMPFTWFGIDALRGTSPSMGEPGEVATLCCPPTEASFAVEADAGVYRAPSGAGVLRVDLVPLMIWGTSCRRP